VLIQLSGRFIIDPGQYPRRLVVELDIGGGFRDEGHPECGVFSGRHDGFEDPEDMNQRIPGFLFDEEVPWVQRYEILAPNRCPPNQRRGYHYVAIGWHDRVYMAYPIPTEVTLENSAGSWSVAIGRVDGGVTVLMPDYSPWDRS